MRSAGGRCRPASTVTTAMVDMAFPSWGSAGCRGRAGRVSGRGARMPRARASARGSRRGCVRGRGARASTREIGRGDEKVGPVDARGPRERSSVRANTVATHSRWMRLPLAVTRAARGSQAPGRAAAAGVAAALVVVDERGEPRPGTSSGSAGRSALTDAAPCVRAWPRTAHRAIRRCGHRLDRDLRPLHDRGRVTGRDQGARPGASPSGDGCRSAYVGLLGAGPHGVVRVVFMTLPINGGPIPCPIPITRNSVGVGRRCPRHPLRLSRSARRRAGRRAE